MRGASLVVVVALSVTSACAVASRAPFDANVFVRAMGDPHEIEGMLSRSVVNGGLWFDDPACSAQFGAPEEIKPDRFAAFARCLAGLHLRSSPRADELADVIVLMYEPGFELEARLIDEGSNTRIAWIGYASRTRDELVVPTITAAALEAHRLTGDRDGPLPPEVAKTVERTPSPNGDFARTWLRVCVAASGAVTIQPRQTTSISAQEAFVQAASAWQFRPFTLRDRTIDVCAMVQLAYPPERREAVETLPVPIPPRRLGHPPTQVSPKALEVQRISGNRVIVPDDDTKRAIAKLRHPRVKADLKLCIDETGRVESILPLQLTGFVSYDRKLLSEVRRWVYKPLLVNGQPVSVCTGLTFIYSQY